MNTYPLHQCRLYKTTSPKDLAKRLGISLPQLQDLAKDSGNYRVWLNSNRREIEEPVVKLQNIHRRIAKYLSRISTPLYLQSTVKQKDYIQNAKVHMNNHPMIKVDIKKFFPSAHREAIYGFFTQHLQIAPHAASLLTSLVTFKEHLPTGSCSSPILAFYAYLNMFNEINELCLSKNLTMSIYVDDITVSGPLASKKVQFEIRKIIHKYGLKSHKTKFYSPKSYKIVTGVRILGNSLSLPKARYQRLKNELASFRGISSPQEKLHKLPRLLSLACEASLIDPKWAPVASKLKELRRNLTALAAQ